MRFLTDGQISEGADDVKEKKKSVEALKKEISKLFKEKEDALAGEHGTLEKETALVAKCADWSASVNTYPHARKLAAYETAQKHLEETKAGEIAKCQELEQNILRLRKAVQVAFSTFLHSDPECLRLLGF